MRAVAPVGLLGELASLNFWFLMKCSLQQLRVVLHCKNLERSRAQQGIAACARMALRKSVMDTRHLKKWCLQRRHDRSASK